MARVPTIPEATTATIPSSPTWIDGAQTTVEVEVHPVVAQGDLVNAAVTVRSDAPKSNPESVTGKKPVEG